MNTWPAQVEHDYVSPHCHHRQHEDCAGRCPVCQCWCLCVCHRWRIPIRGDRVESP